MIAQDHALEEVLINWDNLELTVETRLNSLRDYILQKAGLDKSIEYYEKQGKMLERYVAGFINRYFIILKDVSFILLDPLHILDIIWTFIKNALRHPLKTVKQIWDAWTCLYKLGAYGLGILTADAVLAAIIAGIGVALRGGQLLEIAAEATTTMTQKAVDTATALPRKLVDIGKGLGTVVENFDDVLTVIKQKPDAILIAAKEQIKADANYSGMEKYKYYTSGLRKRDTLT